VRGGRDPLRVVVDGRLRLSPRARMLRQASRALTLIATTTAASKARRAALERAGAEVVAVGARGTTVDLDGLLRELARRGVVSVLIEGGGELAASALRGRLVDRLLVVSAPSLLGGDGRPMLGALGLRRLADAPRLVDATITQLGHDLLREGPVAY
jgi:diaminohydroxyphosphoribosylaminopyrimidine deaminase/5-amino-6-(5-phosphoribosylamino)uracil reductase